MSFATLWPPRLVLVRLILWKRLFQIWKATTILFVSQPLFLFSKIRFTSFLLIWRMFCSSKYKLWSMLNMCLWFKKRDARLRNNRKIWSLELSYSKIYNAFVFDAFFVPSGFVINHFVEMYTYVLVLLLVNHIDAIYMEFFLSVISIEFCSWKFKYDWITSRREVVRDERAALNHIFSRLLVNKFLYNGNFAKTVIHSKEK